MKDIVEPLDSIIEYLNSIRTEDHVINNYLGLLRVIEKEVVVLEVIKYLVDNNKKLFNRCIDYEYNKLPTQL